MKIAIIQPLVVVIFRKLNQNGNGDDDDDDDAVHKLCSQSSQTLQTVKLTLHKYKSCPMQNITNVHHQSF